MRGGHAEVCRDTKFFYSKISFILRATMSSQGIPFCPRNPARPSRRSCSYRRNYHVNLGIKSVGPYNSYVDPLAFNKRLHLHYPHKSRNGKLLNTDEQRGCGLLPVATRLGAKSSAVSD